MKYIEKIGLLFTTILMFVATSCSDYSDYNEAFNDSNMYAGKTLWQNISENEELSDFASLVKKAGYADILNTPGSYTVWAPKNGSAGFDVETLMQLDSAKLVSKFVKQHLANFNMPVNATVEETVLSLNEKKHLFTAEKFDDVNIVRGNIPSSNGVIHVIDGQSTFYPNLYEYLDEVEGCDKFVKYLKKYETKELDTKNSVVGPMVAGKITYLDSVIIIDNLMTTKRLNAKIATEDSSYTMFFPTDAAWDKAVSVIKPHLNYLSSFPYWDVASENSTTLATQASFQPSTGTTKTVNFDGEYYTDSLTNLATIFDLIFSNTSRYNKALAEQDYSVTETDTLRTTTSDYMTNVDKIIASTKDNSVVKMSNGYARITDSIAYKPEEWYNPVFSYGYNNNVMRNGFESQLLFEVGNGRIPYDDLQSRDTLFREVPDWFMKKYFNREKSDNFTYMYTKSLKSNSTRPELDIALNNLHSTKYHMYVITAPEQIDDTLATQKPYYLSFVFTYTDKDGQIKKETLSLNESPAWVDDSWSAAEKKKHIPYKDGTSIVTVPGIINVIDLGMHDIPVSYLGIDAYPTLMMCHTKTYSTSSNRNKYEQNMRVARVVMVPEEVDKTIKWK